MGRTMLMYRVGEFEKVSIEQFRTAMREIAGAADTGCEWIADELYDGISLPVRATEGSAGYDFRAPFEFSLAPGQTIKIPTGIRVKIDGGWWLGCLPRSGLGFKYRVQLNNTMGVIDSDYYYSDNEGHIFAKIINDSRDGKVLKISAGEAFMQGVFLPYGITYSDAASGVRNGGFGSTSAPGVVEFGEAA